MNGPKQLSPTMAAGLEYIRRHGGAIERRPGGIWVHPLEAEFRPGVPYVAPKTVYALEGQGMVSIQWIGRSARAALTPAGIEATNLPPSTISDAA